MSNPSMQLKRESVESISNSTCKMPLIKCIFGGKFSWPLPSRFYFFVGGLQRSFYHSYIPWIGQGVVYMLDITLWSSLYTHHLWMSGARVDQLPSNLLCKRSPSVVTIILHCQFWAYDERVSRRRALNLFTHLLIKRWSLSRYRTVRSYQCGHIVP